MGTSRPHSETVSAETPPRLCATDLPPSLPPTSRAVIRGRLDFVVAVHGLQGRLRLTIARLELGPRGLCLPHVVFRSGSVWRARQPAPVPRTRRRSPHSAQPPPARCGCIGGGRLLVFSAQPPPARCGCIGGGRRPRHSPRGARSPCGAPRRRQARPLVPRGTLGGRPARRRVVEGARYGGPDPEGLHPATPCRRRPQGRDVAIDGARGARLCDKHDRTPKRPTLLLP